MMAKKVKKVAAKVTSVKGVCGLGHKVGDVVTFSETGVEGHICVHALYSLMPKVFAMIYNAEFPWATDPDVLTHPCPDAVNPVVFELRRFDAE
ncbi:MAG: TIGR04076 family protein [Candidatus Aminicenantes bacterium]|nr:TIGR04076 family protein [Candidatus Aminicenantes bacterium]